MIWIIGGTRDSRDIIERLAGMEIIVSTATDYGKKILGEIKSISDPMDREEMVKFIKSNTVRLVVDASHPYAANVSKNAISACQSEKITYLRFERKMLAYSGGIKLDSIEEVVSYLNGVEGNILVTLGSNNLDYFSSMKNLGNIYFRILPVMESLEKSRRAGILPKNIIALQGPFSKEFNRAIYKNYNIKYVVTKESGTTGGELEKIEAAEECGVKPIILSRPAVDYPWKTESINQLIEKVKEYEKA